MSTHSRKIEKVVAPIRKKHGVEVDLFTHNWVFPRKEDIYYDIIFNSGKFEKPFKKRAVEILKSWGLNVRFVSELPKVRNPAPFANCFITKTDLVVNEGDLMAVFGMFHEFGHWLMSKIHWSGSKDSYSTDDQNEEIAVCCIELALLKSMGPWYGPLVAWIANQNNCTEVTQFAAIGNDLLEVFRTRKDKTAL